MKKIIVVIAFLGITLNVFGQGQITLYQMQKTVPQTNHLNPAFFPDSKVTVGLPLISSNYLSLQSPMTIDDLFTRGPDDSLRIDTLKIIEGFQQTDKIEFDGNVGLLLFGLNTKSGFFSASFNSRVDGSFRMPSQVVNFLIRGPNNDPTQPGSISIENTDFGASWFNELAIGYSRKINRKLRVGGRLKYLQGIGNINVENLNGFIQTDIDSVHISMEPWRIETSGLRMIEGGSRDYFLFKNDNRGWAIDIGGEYEILDNLKVSASILDLGGITWRTDTKSYLFPGGNYTFEGFDLISLLDQSGANDFDSLLNQELDTIQNIFDPEEVEGASYKTSLISKYYLGGNYTLSDIHTFGLILYGEVFKGQLNPSVGLTYNIQVGKILNVGVNASYRNNSFSNFGGGISLDLGPIQLYTVADSFQSYLFSTNARTVSFRFGINVLAGKNPNRSVGLD